MGSLDSSPTRTPSRDPGIVDSSSNLPSIVNNNLNRILEGGYDSDDEHNTLFELTELCATAGRLELNVEQSDQDYIEHNLSWNPVRQWLETHSIEEELIPALQIRDQNGKTAVHFVCQHQPPMDIVDYLLNAHPSSFQAQDVCGWTALHYACASSAQPSVLQSIAEEWSEAKVALTDKGLTPLHLALIGPFREHSPDLIATLASTGASRIVDNQGLLVRWIVIAYLDEVRKEDKIHLTE
jgi:ankyrin repeat protein